jgi:hypothetical protein
MQLFLDFGAFSNQGKKTSSTSKSKTTSSVNDTQSIFVNTEGVFFNINSPKIMPISNCFKYSSKEESGFYPISFGQPARLFPISISSLNERISIPAKCVVKTTFTANDITLGHSKKSQNIIFWLVLDGNGPTTFLKGQSTFLKGQFAEKFVELVGIPVASIFSNNMVFLRLKIEVFEEPSIIPNSQSQEEISFTVKPFTISNLVKIINFTYPLNLRGFIVDTRPNPMGLDFDLYLRETIGNRFNRFTLKGIGAESNDDFFKDNRFLKNAFNYIRELFCETHEIKFPNPDNSAAPLRQFNIKLYDEIRAADTLSSVVACSFGGFKRLATFNLKDGMKKPSEISPPNSDNLEGNKKQ